MHREINIPDLEEFLSWSRTRQMLWCSKNNSCTIKGQKSWWTRERYFGLSMSEALERCPEKVYNHVLGSLCGAFT